jgi:predicted O-methyltransferase YrrM
MASPSQNGNRDERRREYRRQRGRASEFRRRDGRCDDPAVDPTVQQIIDDLTRAAEEHDARRADRLDRWRVLEPDAGRFLWFLVQSLRATTIVEIGTSRGVSTLWLADAARATGGRVVTIDTDATAQEAARRSVEDAGLADLVSFRVEDGGAALAGYGDGEVDLLFLDAERTEYPSWWPHPVRVLRAGGVLVADNALSHPDEIAPLHDLLRRSLTAVTTIPVGKGELVGRRPESP